LNIGGYITAVSAATESWNGSAWTTVNSLNTARQALAGAGTQTAALAFGGKTPTTGATELYNGTTWTSNPTSMTTARDTLGGTGTQSLAIAFGGLNPGITAATEAFTGVAVKTITVS
jgi:hypothetical protein